MSGPETTARVHEKVRTALESVDGVLQRNQGFYPKDLPAHYYARLTGWQPGVKIETPEQFDRLNPLERAIEVSRAHAEALLANENLGVLMLDLKERELRTRRALGILPNSEEHRFGEILACPELQPRSLARTPNDLLSAVAVIGDHVTPATGLAYGMLVLGGIRSAEPLLGYAKKIDKLFDRLTSMPSVIQALDHQARIGEQHGVSVQASMSTDGSFQAHFGVLLAVHEHLWAFKPQRASTPFLLSQVIDNYLGPQRGVGNSLGLAMIDSVILGKLGFPVRYHVDDGILHLEVMVQNRSVYWEVTRPSTLSFVPVASGKRVELKELFALTLGSIATIHFSTGRVEKSVELYRSVLELLPNSAETLNSLGACYIRRQMPEEAVKAIKLSIEADSTSAEAYHNLGNAYALMERWPRAIDAFKSAIRLRPDYVEAYNNLGFAFHRSGSPEQAVASFQAAIEMRPDYARAHFNLGNIQLELKRCDEAIKCYKHATQLEPNMVQAYYNMGQAYYQLRKLDPAIASFRKAISINPKHYGAWHNLGIAYRDKGLKDKAVEALEQAVTINPNLMR